MALLLHLEFTFPTDRQALDAPRNAILITSLSRTFQCPLGLELLRDKDEIFSRYLLFQCPLGLELLRKYYWFWYPQECVSMPSRAYTSFLHWNPSSIGRGNNYCVNALSGWYLISTLRECLRHLSILLCVNALSGWYLISTSCIPFSDANGNTRVNALSGWYLISTYWALFFVDFHYNCVNALSGLYLISTGRWAFYK